MLTGSPVAASIVPAQGMSLYIHVPFCQTKCPYCDFNTYQGIEGLMAPYQEALAAELRLWGETLGHPKANTVFFGGGTPSYLPEGSIKNLLEAAQGAFPFSDTPEITEITMEANPGDLTADSCRRFIQAGVNRLSIGVQSLDNGLLSLLGRRHDAAGAVEAFKEARRAGLDNINLDLMYGLPHQTLAQWQDTVQQVVDLQPSHLSLYCLTLEEGTPLHRWVAQGKLPQPDPDLAADMYQHARSVLAGAGYHHYEISNWCLPGLPARHNLTYWLNRPYLGVGPGAHSCLGGIRFWDTASPRGYMDQVKQWAERGPQPGHSWSEAALADIPPVGGCEVIDPDTAAAETMFLGLRLLDGLDLDEASAQLGVDLSAKYRTPITELTESGLLERQGRRLRLTPEAYLIANQVFTRFM